MKLEDLIDRLDEEPWKKFKLFVGWREVVDVQVRTDRVYPYVELVLEDNGDGEDHF